MLDDMTDLSRAMSLLVDTEGDTEYYTVYWKLKRLGV